MRRHACFEISNAFPPRLTSSRSELWVRRLRPRRVGRSSSEERVRGPTAEEKGRVRGLPSQLARLSARFAIGKQDDTSEPRLVARLAAKSLNCELEVIWALRKRKSEQISDGEHSRTRKCRGIRVIHAPGLGSMAPLHSNCAGSLFRCVSRYFNNFGISRTFLGARADCFSSLMQNVFRVSQ